MSTSPLRRRIAGIVVAALATAPVVALTAPGANAVVPTAAPAITSSVDFDYLADKFTALASQRGQHVFETITIERLKYLLRFKSGKYAVLIGDPKDASVQAEIGYINEAAKSIGVQKIYVFNPRIDGNDLNVFDWTELATQLGGAGLDYWKNEGPAATTGGPLIDLINGNSPDPEFVRSVDGKVTSPYLVVLDKDHKDGSGNDDRVVSSLSGTKTAADLDTPSEQAAYIATVKQTLLDGGTVTTPDLSVNTQFEFYKDEVNRRHSATYTDPVRYGANILTDSDGTDGWRVQQLSYPEAVDLLTNPLYADSDVPFLFGGTWCHNTRAVIKNVNADAQANGVKTVYNLDFSLFSTSNGGTNYDHIRTSGTPGLAADGKLLAPGHLYGDLVNTYLYNAVAEYAKTGEPGASPNLYYPGGDTTKTVQSARRLQVPALLVYNHDHKDASGNAAPVVDQALRTNDNGTYTEYMTEYWFVAGHDLPNTADTTLYGTSTPGSDRLTNSRDFASEALDAYADVFRSLSSAPRASTTAVSVDGTSSTDLVPGTTPALSVAVTADGYAPFITFNANGANVARNTGTGSPVGSVVVLDPDGHQVGSPVALKRDGSAVSITLPAITSDQIGDVWKVKYLGRGYSIAPSTTDLKVGKRSAVTLAGATSTPIGTAVTYTATVTAGATGSVSLAGLPGSAITAPIVDGAAALVVPASVPAGTYTVTATYAGDDLYASSVSAPITLTVNKLASKATVTAVTSSTYGTAVKATVKVTDAAGGALTGSVSLTGAGATLSATLSAAGQAVVTLPATLAAKAYTLKATYAGSAVYASSVSAPLTLTVKPLTTKATVTAAKSSTYGKAVKVTVKVTDGAGKAVTGKVSLTGAGAAKTATLSSTGQAVVTLPASLAVKSYKLKATYAGNANVTGSTASASLKVTKGKVSKVTTKVTKASTSKAKGKATVTVTTAKGLAKATGKVKVTLTKGKAKKTVTVTLKSGKATVTLPKLAKGTWKVSASYAGSTTYAAANAKAVKSQVKK